MKPLFCSLSEHTNNKATLPETVIAWVILRVFFSNFSLFLIEKFPNILFLFIQKPDT